MELSPPEVAAFLAIGNKQVTKPFAWSVQASGHAPKSHVFESGVQVGQQVLEGVMVRARYRGVKHIARGQASLVIPESFSCALFIGHERVAALDTNPGQKHTNKIGDGLPYFGRTICTDTHRHVWTGAYGYVEPVEPALLDVVQLLGAFAVEFNFVFRGVLRHPLTGAQMGLGI